IRDGARSLLEGAPRQPGASTLAHIAGAPIVPSVIVGSDRLYSKKSWLSLRRPPIWVAFGDPIPHFPNLEKSAARARTERELAAAFKILYAELRETFSLTPNDLPHPPRERMRVELPTEETAGSHAAGARRQYWCCTRSCRRVTMAIAAGQPALTNSVGTRVSCICRITILGCRAATGTANWRLPPISSAMQRGCVRA